MRRGSQIIRRCRIPGLIALAIASALASLVGPSPRVLRADPCGMVPPIYIGPGAPITRVGLQQTYVFYQGGVEAFVIRPGFRGNVDNFGMLIPFPSPPSLRKVPDNVFQQIAHAIDPPEVVVDLRPRMMAMRDGAPGQEVGGLSFERKAQGHGVRVIRREAVGMYDIAVLEAGSANALKRWMDENGFVYPSGMDQVTNEYIDQGWCFVAVKTRVANGDAVQPRPGQRELDSRLPAGSAFEGAVQAMGFRFHSDRLVVPMRLSAFNDGELRNVVYLLTDEPKRIRAIPEEYVVRQLSGEQLVDHLTRPLPLRIIGGTLKDIPEFRMEQLRVERDPKPHNGVAAQLFASDLSAVQGGTLILPHETREKQLLDVGEYFGLRGTANDELIAKATQREAERRVAKMMTGLKSMTLTVVDGDFPREVLARENLTFSSYVMPEDRNSPRHYDAKTHGPAPKQEGIRVSDLQLRHFRETKSVEVRTSSVLGAMAPGAFFLLAAIWHVARRRRS